MLAGISIFAHFPIRMPTTVGIAAPPLIHIFRYALLVTLPLWILTHTLYRIKVHGLENLPDKGPYLIVSNHVTYLDAIFILAALKRKVRFLIWAPFMGIPGLRLLLRFGK